MSHGFWKPRPFNKMKLLLIYTISTYYQNYIRNLIDTQIEELDIDRYFKRFIIFIELYYRSLMELYYQFMW